MKISHLQWPALVLAAVLGLDSLAVSSEPMAGNKISGSTSCPSEGRSPRAVDQHVSGRPDSRAASSDSEPPVEPPASQHRPVRPPARTGVVEAAQPVFQPASWTNSLDNNIGFHGTHVVGRPPACDAMRPARLHDRATCATAARTRCGCTAAACLRTSCISVRATSTTSMRWSRPARCRPIRRPARPAAWALTPTSASASVRAAASANARASWPATPGSRPTRATRSRPSRATCWSFSRAIRAFRTPGATAIEASADYYLRFQQFDIDYRGLLYGDCESAVNYFAGVRYANLKQTFGARKTLACRWAW